MRLRNGDHGYGAVTKLLHWVTLLALAAQFTIGWRMEADDPADRAKDRVDAFEERGRRLAEARGEAAEERFSAEVERREDAADAVDRSAGSPDLGDVVTGAAFGDGISMVEAHVSLGLGVLVLGLTRLLWRRTTPLPPWAAHLSASERVLEAWLEKVLLTMLLLVPATGLLLVAGEDDLLAVHVAAQIALLVTVGGHVALVLKHTVAERNRHLSRML